MLNSLVDSFINLDDKNKNKVMNIISKIINPVKLYLIIVILLLLIMCLSNYYMCRKLCNISLPINSILPTPNMPISVS